MSIHVPATPEQLHELISTIDAIVSEFDARRSVFTYVSAALERVLGYSAEQFLGSPRFWFGCIHPDDRERVRELSRAAKGGSPADPFDYRIHHADGRIVWLRDHSTVVLGDDGQPSCVRGVSVDVTALKEAQAEGERAHSMFQATLDGTGDAILVVDLVGRITAYNRPFAQLWRVPQFVQHRGDGSDALADVLGSVAEPDEFIRRVTEIYEDPAGATYDVFGLSDGRTIERDSAPQRLAGAIVGRVWCFRDITEKLAAQQALRESEQRYRETLENVALIAAGIDARGIVTFANDFLIELTGWSRDEVVGHDWFERFDGDPDVRRDYFDCMARGEIRKHFESTVQTRSGETRSVSWSSTIQRDEAGAVDGIVTIGEDVTERRRAEEELRLREEHFRTLIENASDVISVLSADGTSLYESPSVERVLGWTPEELVGTRNFALRHPDDAERVTASVERILGSEAAEPIEFRLRHKNGSWRTVESVAQMRTQGGVPVLVSNYRDVTDQRELQQQLLHSQRLEAVGRLAGGIAHDFNNLLTAIGGYTEHLISGFDPGDPRREDALEIARAAERAAALTQQLLAFSRHQVLQPETLELATVVEDLGSLLARLLGEDIEIRASAEPGCFVDADRGQLEQVITNLAVNARDAMPGVGRLSISTRHVEHAGVQQVELAVADTGTGMDAETLSHLFEPFFTTKDASKGSGLGLATVYGIVAQSGGEVLVDSVLGGGSSFRVLLPLADRPEDVTKVVPEPPIVTFGTETILVVEDEDTIRRLVSDVLERSGYTVLAAPAGAEAIDLLHANDVDLLLTDVIMPGMSGPDLARIALAHQPDLHVLFTSGYIHEPDELLTGLDAAFIGKPFLPAPLVAKVREVLDSGADSAGDLRSLAGEQR
ncbi:MAG: PAS domain S-box protein [Actinobacteria bacterium]|nr:PAS domain S-box protein [Actinomycetota bacterium]